MVFKYNKLADYKATDQSMLSKVQMNGAQNLDTEQIFRLLDSVLYFEACLYHQVLPLALAESRLNLGMVNPEDTGALDYVSRILSYMNCSLLPQPIAADTHRAMLSAYLNYRGTSKPAAELVHTPLASAKPLLAADHAAKKATAKRHGETVRANQNDQPTLILDDTATLHIRSADQKVAATAKHLGKETAKANQNDRPTLILADTEVLHSRSANQGNSQKPLLPKQSTTPSAPQEPLGSNSIAESNTQVAQTLPPLAVPPPYSYLPVLEVEAAYLSNAVEELATLPPKKLLQELLGRVLVEGIGRLYFERQFPNFGRILWSQNGVLQSVLEELPLPVFEEVLNELKELTHQPLSPVQEPKQAEIECLYEQNRLLLRLSLMPGAAGEEATLQVLRGAALKFYQQRQLAHLSRDALGMAQQLQRKLNELRERTHLNSNLSAKQLEALPALNQLLENTDQQLQVLKQLQA